MIQRARAGGEGRHSDEAMAMLLRGGQALDNIARGGGVGGGARQAGSGWHEEGGGRMQGKRAADNTTGGSLSWRQMMVEPARAGIR
jgi:hypothetical protein